MRTLAPGHVPTVAKRLTPLRTVPGTNRMQVEIGVPLRDAAAATERFNQIYDPASPNYHQYLSPAEFTETYGPTTNDFQKVIDFAKAQGMTVTATSSNRLVVQVQTTSADIERAFHLKMQVYQHPTEAREFFAPDREPSVTAGVPILNVGGLNNYLVPRPNMHVSRGRTNSPVRAGTGPNGLGYMGSDFRNAYAPGVSLDGTGQFVALIDGQYFANDPVIYAKDAGITLPTITNIYVGGSPQGDPPAGTDDGEQSLDISMIMSLAPHATIMVYEGDADACFVQMAVDNKAKQISCSLGWGPASPMLAQEFEQFDAQGQAFFAASGDGGSGGDDSDTSGGGPGAANEYITLVGGTSLTTSGAGGPWQSETTWGGSGGAICTNLPIPSYQHGAQSRLNRLPEFSRCVHAG